MGGGETKTPRINQSILTELTIDITNVSSQIYQSILTELAR